MLGADSLALVAASRACLRDTTVARFKKYHSRYRRKTAFGWLSFPVADLLPARMDFPATEWSLLAQATLHGEAAAAEALAEFCRRYRQPLIQFIRQRGTAPSEAEDLAQDFLLHVMQKSTLRRADAARGRFRSFLIGALIRFLRDARQRTAAAKRGGGLLPVAMNGDDSSEDLPAISPDDVTRFDREWAQQLLALALDALREEYQRLGKSELYGVLRSYLPGSTASPPYEHSAQQLGLSLGAFKTEVHRLRERFRRQLEREVALTVTTPDEIELEISYLGRVLANTAG
jgi:RNA polymerase sigma factor (sigma-70 family)